LEHIAVEYPTPDDLLSDYARLKEIGTLPILIANIDGTIAFYYLDLDDNCIKRFARIDASRPPYSRLREMRIASVLSANHRATAAFYYLDFDGNCIKEVEDHSDGWERPGQWPGRRQSTPSMISLPVPDPSSPPRGAVWEAPASL
jgi:hypothetical protein